MSKQVLNLEFKFKDAVLTLPHQFHFGSVVNEVMKQVRHTMDWFRKQYSIYKRQLIYKKKTYHVQQPKQAGQSRAFKLIFDIKKGKYSWDEDPLKQVFVEKDEIV